MRKSDLFELISAIKSETSAVINKKLGVFSQYQIEHGFYADAFGIGTVILLTGWQERLQNLTNEKGETIAYVAEIYDRRRQQTNRRTRKGLRFSKRINPARLHHD